MPSFALNPLVCFQITTHLWCAITFSFTVTVNQSAKMLILVQMSFRQQGRNAGFSANLNPIRAGGGDCPPPPPTTQRRTFLNSDGLFQKAIVAQSPMREELYNARNAQGVCLRNFKFHDLCLSSGAGVVKDTNDRSFYSCGAAAWLGIVPKN